MEEKSQKSLEELEQELMTHPIRTMGYTNVKKQIEEIIKDRHEYNKYLICFSNKMGWGRLFKEANEQELSDMNDITDHNDIELIDSGLPFSETKTFIEDKRFSFIPRYEAEYDVAISQLAVACYITDGENIVLLYPTKGRIHDLYTMIQGHVDYDQSCYFAPQLDFLHMNIIRELSEELDTGDMQCSFILPREPKYYINTNKSIVDMEHFGIVYEIRVPDVEDLMKSIKSGEPDKHSIVSLKLSDYDEYSNKLDTWSNLVICKLTGRID